MKLRESMPELTGATEWVNSGELLKGDLIGTKPVLIHFWSISCYSCKKGMEKINYFYEAYEDKLNVVTIHMPRSEEDRNTSLIKQTADAYQLKKPIAIDDNHTITDLFNNRYVPAFYLFDQKGKLRYLQSGKTGTTVLRTRINRILKEIEIRL